MEWLFIILGIIIYCIIFSKLGRIVAESKGINADTGIWLCLLFGAFGAIILGCMGDNRNYSNEYENYYKLECLKKLKDSNILTEEEFKNEKQKILSRNVSFKKNNKNIIINLEDDDGTKYKIKIMDTYKYDNNYYAIGIDLNWDSSVVVLKLKNSDNGLKYNLLCDKDSITVNEVLKLYDERRKNDLCNTDLLDLDKLPQI